MWIMLLFVDSLETFMNDFLSFVTVDLTDYFYEPFKHFLLVSDHEKNRSAAQQLKFQIVMVSWMGICTYDHSSQMQYVSEEAKV